MFYGETGVRYSCFGAETQLALFSLFIHLTFIQMNFLLEAELKQCAVVCLFSSVPVRAREVTLPDCVLSLLGGQQHTLLSAAPDYYCKNANMSCDNENK